MIALIIIFILIIAIDFALGKFKKIVFLEAIVFSAFLILTSYLSLLISLTVFYFIHLFIIHVTNEIFLQGIIIMLSSGLVEFYIVKYVEKKIKLKDVMLTIIEYFIQWMLIYLTLYQIIDQSYKSIDWEDSDLIFKQLFHIDISQVNLLLLPTFMISWIAIAMNKIIKSNNC